MTDTKLNPQLIPYDRAYVEGGRWKCPSPDSTTGAHWWVAPSNSTKFRCKWCGEWRVFNPSMRQP